MRIGIHTSISGSLEKAALKAAALGANCFQIFSASPRTWRAGVPAPDQIRLMKLAREKYDLCPLVIHDNYLINLASSDEALRQKSALAFRGEMERAIAIGAEYLVAHPGNSKGHTVEEGIYAVVQSLTEAAHGLITDKLTILLENTAGGGAMLGGCFEELMVIRQYAEKMSGLRIGYCLDTCHCFVSNYDVSTAEGLKKTVSEIDRLLDMENVPVMHANDSKGERGSHVDRHEHIGDGNIGEDGFRRILRHPKLKKKAFILETPHDEERDAVRNIETLKRLADRRTV
ncbi:MAG TPA: deoxyribonuclease IV [Bryobacteraceae bacterium]|nr:deoxyribonuclease IV [Bryobacteraceae bacterium]